MENPKVINQVLETTDLSIFKQIDGNRVANLKHVKRLEVSIRANGWLNNPILVNDKMQVIDGQHRLEAAKLLGCSITYIVEKDYNLRHVHTLNLNQKNWTKADYLAGYADMGVKSYVRLRDFQKRNPEFNITDCIALCSNITTGSNFSHGKAIDASKSGASSAQVFEDGTWLSRDMEVAQANANILRGIGAFYPNYHRSTFVGTLLLMLANPNFSSSVFMAKLKANPTALKDAATREQCKLMIEDIYNYRSKNKISLRY